MKRPGLLIILILITLVTGCGKDKSTNSESNGPLMPLAVGNRWYYRCNYYDEDGNKLYSDAFYVGIFKDSVYNDTLWHIATSTGTGSAFANLDGGLYILPLDSYAPVAASSLYMKYPGKANDEFYIGSVLPVKIISTNAGVTVPANTYSCYKYGLFIGSDSIYFYYSPGTGLVRTEYISYEGGDNPTYLYYEEMLTSLVLH